MSGMVIDGGTGTSPSRDTSYSPEVFSLQLELVLKGSTPLSLGGLKALRLALFALTQYQSFAVSTANFLGMKGNTPDLPSAWQVLKTWMDECGVTPDQLAAEINSQNLTEAFHFDSLPPATMVAVASLVSELNTRDTFSFSVSGAAGTPPVVARSPLFAPAPTLSPELASGALSENEFNLKSELRLAWTHPGFIPSAEVQNYLIQLVVANHVLPTDSVAMTDLVQIRNILRLNDPKKLGDSWDLLRAWAKRVSFGNYPLRLRLLQLARPPKAAEIPEDPRLSASPTHLRAYDTLAALCTQSGGMTENQQKITVRYPYALPDEWLTAGKASIFTLARARLHDWQVADLIDSRFLVPPLPILKYLISAQGYEHLIDFGLANAESRPITSSPEVSLMDDLVTKLKALMPQTTLLADGSGRTLHVAAFVRVGSSIPNGDVLGALAEGASLVRVDDTLFLLPASFIGKADNQIAGSLLLQLNTFGIIGLRGGPAAPWWVLCDSEDLENADPFAEIRESAAGPLNLPDFLAAQRTRWGQNEIGPVVSLSENAWLKSYPELRSWLAAHLAYVEPLDLWRLQRCLSLSENAFSINTILGNTLMLQGVLGEIAIRPQIVEEYRRLLPRHPLAVLAVAPQIFSGDVREASDAVIFDPVQLAGQTALRLLSVWEVATTSNQTQALKRQLSYELNRRFIELGLHLRGNDHTGSTFLIDPLLENTQTHAAELEDSQSLTRVVDKTRQRLTTQFGQHEWTVNAHGEAVARGAARVSKITPHLDVARTQGYSFQEFAGVLAESDRVLSVIFTNMTSPPDGKRKTALELAGRLPFSESSISRWEDIFSEIILINHWNACGRSEKSSHHSLNIRRTKKAGPILSQAREGTFKTPQDLYAALLGEAPVHAATLQNLFFPDQGIRLTQDEVAKPHGVSHSAIQGCEDLILEAVADLGWQELKQDESIQRAKASRLVTPKINQLMADAVAKKISRQDFEASLLELDIEVYLTFENIVVRPDGKRLSVGVLAQDNGFPETLAFRWNKRFEQLCVQCGWAIYPAPSHSEVQAGRAALKAIPKEKMLADLRAATEILGRVPTQTDLITLKMHSPTTYAKYFGSFRKALFLAGLITTDPDTKAATAKEHSAASVVTTDHSVIAPARTKLMIPRSVVLAARSPHVPVMAPASRPQLALTIHALKKLGMTPPLWKPVGSGFSIFAVK